MVFQKEIRIKSDAFDSVIDITNDIARVVKESSIQNGLVNVFNIGSTASITTIEYEPGLKRDFPEFLNKIIPRGANYHHNDTWQDGNGDGHLKATLIGPQITCPVNKQELVLGTWQQIIFIEFDNRSRKRKIITQFMGI